MYFPYLIPSYWRYSFILNWFFQTFSGEKGFCPHRTQLHHPSFSHEHNSIVEKHDCYIKIEQTTCPVLFTIARISPFITSANLQSFLKYQHSYHLLTCNNLLQLLPLVLVIVLKINFSLFLNSMMKRYDSYMASSSFDLYLLPKIPTPLLSSTF